MAIGTVVKHTRKSGIFTTGQLLAGQIGVDVTNSRAYLSTDGSNIIGIQSDTVPVVTEILSSRTITAAEANLHATFLYDATSGGCIFTLPDSSGLTQGKAELTFANIGGGGAHGFIKPDSSDVLYFVSLGIPYTADNSNPAGDDGNNGTTMWIRYIGNGAWVALSLTGAWLV